MEKLELVNRLKEILTNEDVLPFNKEAHELKSKFVHLQMGEAGLEDNSDDTSSDELIAVVEDAEGSTEEVSDEVLAVVEDAEGSTEEISNEVLATVEDAEGFTEEVSDEVLAAVEDAEGSTEEISDEVLATVDDAEGFTEEISNEVLATVEDAEGFTEEISNEVLATVEDAEAFTEEVSDEVLATVEDAGAFTEEVSDEVLAAVEDAEGSTEEISEEIEESVKEVHLATAHADELSIEFDDLYMAFKTKHKEQLDVKKNAEKENLTQKNALIGRLRILIQEEENIGVAFSSQKQIQEQWREIGDIPRDLRQDVQNEYSRLMEQFYYNIGIYKELREYDLKRNQDLKEEIIAKLKLLAQNKQLQEVETELKVLQHEWEDIGGTFQEIWEDLKAQYWSIVKSLYDRIRNYYEAKREVMNKNLETKRELIVKTEQIVNELLEGNDHAAWEKGTKELIALQEAWKGIGFGPRKENEEVWNTFRGICDKFFEAKHAFYKDRNKIFDTVVDLKRALTTKVNDLKDSTNWKEATQQIIVCQNDWKKLGNAGPRNEQKLWKDFRAACDGFFNRKQEHFAEMDTANSENLALKQAIIQEIEAYKAKEDKIETLTNLRAFSSKFTEIGNVPFKEKDTVYNAFKAAMDKHYEEMNLKGAEKDKVMYESRLSTLASSPQSKKLYDEERWKLRAQIQKSEQEIRQYENNLGFFSKSKAVNPLMKTVEKSIESARKTIDDCKNKLKLIPNE